MKFDYGRKVKHYLSFNLYIIIEKHRLTFSIKHIHCHRIRINYTGDFPKVQKALRVYLKMLLKTAI